MNLPNQFHDLIIHMEMINQFYWIITTITLSCHHSWITNAPADPFILTIEDPPAEYLFQNRFRNAYTSGGHLQAVGAVENDYDPRITIRLHTRRGKNASTVTYAQMDGEEKWFGPCFIWRTRLSSAYCKIYTVSLPKRVARQLHKRVQHFILHLSPLFASSNSKILVMTDFAST